MGFLDDLAGGFKALAPMAANLVLPGSGSFVASAIRQITGDTQTDINTLAQQVQQNPKLMVELEKALIQKEVELAKTEVKKLETVNASMLSEANSADPWQRRWRPYWGFISGTAFGIQIFGLMFLGGWAIIRYGKDAVPIIGALAGLASALLGTWALALAVLGVAVWKRSSDKKVAAGATGSAVQLLTKFFGKN